MNPRKKTLCFALIVPALEASHTNMSYIFPCGLHLDMPYPYSTTELGEDLQNTLRAANTLLAERLR